jgi:hypothetical protein
LFNHRGTHVALIANKVADAALLASISIGALLLYSCDLAQPNAFGPIDDVRGEVAEQLVIIEEI